MDSDERNFLKNLYREGKLSFEKDFFKILLNLSTGALVLSITVAQIGLKKIHAYSWLLLVSWILLCITVFTVLMYFILGQYEFEKRIEDIEYEQDPVRGIDKEIAELAQATDEKIKGHNLKSSWIMNESSIKRRLYDKLGFIGSLTFLFGIIALGVFTYINLFLGV